MNRTITATSLAVAVLLVSGCASTGSPTAGKSPSPAASPSSTAREYDEYDCKALLERTYAADKLRDASGDPECKGLTHAQYIKAVGDVLSAHKDDIMANAANEVAWDEAWDQTDADQQRVVCSRLKADGAEIVGQEMADSSDAPSGDEVKMVQYYLDNKC